MSNLTLPPRVADAELVDKPEKLPQHLRCSSCQKPLFNAYQTPHGCRLCEKCVQDLPLEEKKLCPGNTEACREDGDEIYINQGLCYSDNATRREVAKLQVWCPNKANGCQKSDKWRNIDAHLDNCDYQREACRQCGESVLKKQMQEHLRQRCPRRLVPCDLCRQEVVYSSLESEHKNLELPACCERLEAACPFGCGQLGLTRQKFVAHQRECPKKPTDCKYQHLGCREKRPQEELDDHYKDNVHVHTELLDARVREIQRSPNARTVSAGVAGAAASEAAGGPETDKDVKEFTRRMLNVYNVFKKLQISVADWAQTTLEFEDLLGAFGGMSSFKTFLKNVEERGRPAEGVAASRSEAAGLADELSRLWNRLKDIEFRFRTLELTSYDGGLAWKVPDVAAKLREAKAGRPAPQPLLSPPFFCRRYGHMLRARLSFGDDVSVSLRVDRSEYDDILEWPFVADATYRLVCVRNRGQDAAASARISCGRDQLSDTCGERRLASLQELSSDRFVRSDCLYVEVEVEQRTEAGAGGKGRKR